MIELSPPGVTNALADPWQAILGFTLIANGMLLAAYRFWRYTKGGPKPDAIGGAVLGLIAIALGTLVLFDVSWARWPALVYGSLFALVVMPIWTLAVLIPLPPGPLDYAFAGLYEASLLVIVVSAIAV